MLQTSEDRPSVLIVEDEIFVAMDIERVLADAGYTVVGIAADHDEAMTSGSTATIAFVDINLRDGPTGPSIACDLADRHGVRVVYVTANPQQIEPRASTAIGYVRKPFSDGAILSAAALAANGNVPVADEGVTLFEVAASR